jgi:2-polyprenyl-3-methyl-5-hydroxy-6-metoxy-1,4-benzoquinol methylase
VVSEIEIYQTEEGFSRAHPLPTKEELEEFYTNTYYQEGHGNYKDKYEPRKFNNILYKLHKKIILLRSLFIPEPENFLDIGCGQGYALKTFSENGWDVTGIDYTNRTCMTHHPDMINKVVEGDIYDVLESAGKYQVVHADNVLEHVLDPYKFIELCKDALKPGGILIIDVPNENSIFHQWLMKEGILNDVFERKYPDHLSFFNLPGLRNLCKKYGLAELFIGDFSITHMGFNGITVSVEDYLKTLPINKALMFYCMYAELGFGPELMGFFRANGKP